MSTSTPLPPSNEPQQPSTKPEPEKREGGTPLITDGDDNKKQLPSHAAAGTDQHEVIAIIGYVLPFLFFIPLLTEAKDNTFSKYHANQQLNLLLFEVVAIGISSALTPIFIGLLFMPIAIVISTVLAIIGIVNVLNGATKPLPYIGKYQLLK